MRLPLTVAAALLLLALGCSSVTALMSTPPAVPTPNTDCEGCKMIVRSAMEIAGNQTEIAEVIAILISDCHALHLNASEEALCDSLATTLVNLLPKIKKGLSDLAWPLPEGICSVLLHQCNLQCCDATTPYLPEQIHLSLTNTPSEMMVSWVTFRPAGDAQVQWGPDTTLGYSAAAEVSTYTVAGWVGTIYNALMTGLKPSTTYNYRVGSSASWSRGITFRTLPSYADYQCQSKVDGHDQLPTTADFPPLRFAVIGDMAYDNFSDATVSYLLRQLNNGSLDVVLHAGDISYADGYQPHWDLYMRKIEPIASRVPYMVVPGNHEFWFNFTAYKSRWFMPGASSLSVDPTMFYSVNIGPVHLMGFDTETWIDTADINPLQKKWIQHDLTVASGRKSQQPWLITMGHRPLYCSNSNKQNCHDFAGLLQALIEDTFVLSKVDLVITAHQHDYERSWPTYKGKAISTNYSNPQVPVYLVNGAAGNREELTGGFVEPAPSWVANRIREYGYGRLTWTPQGTGPGTLTWQFFGDGDTLHDQFVLVKNHC